MAEQVARLRQFIREIPDWPKKGVMFRDITPLLAHHYAFGVAVNLIIQPFLNSSIDYVAAVEARGFIFGVAAAQRLGAGIIPIRKAGKLPHQTHSESYALEYGTDSIEIHKDAVPAGANVLLVDDLLATGGTMVAAARLIEKIPARVAGVAFLIELDGLMGREKLRGYNLHSVIHYQ
ncbi:MAG TPA: adenine phosphoribosyltransferase [Sedimentisphaerales bacterium]|nr:adenine phosphoribosyltransferase [Sedimentisphaerales bacterium]